MKRALILVLFLALSTSCSVMMAARKEGVNISRVQTTHSRLELLSLEPKILASESLSNGELVEVYQIQNERGSAARAFMHGILDISTMGLWEVIGTPLEATIAQREHFVIKVYYDEIERVKKIELL